MTSDSDWLYLFGKEVQAVKPKGLGPRAGVDCPQHDTPCSIKPASVHFIRHVAAPEQRKVLSILLTDSLLGQGLQRSTYMFDSSIASYGLSSVLWVRVLSTASMLDYTSHSNAITAPTSAKCVIHCGHPALHSN